MIMSFVSRLMKIIKPSFNFVSIIAFFLNIFLSFYSCFRFVLRIWIIGFSTHICYLLISFKTAIEVWYALCNWIILWIKLTSLIINTKWNPTLNVRNNPSIHCAELKANYIRNSLAYLDEMMRLSLIKYCGGKKRITFDRLVHWAHCLYR